MLHIRHLPESSIAALGQVCNHRMLFRPRFVFSQSERINGGYDPARPVLPASRIVAMLFALSLSETLPSFTGTCS